MASILTLSSFAQNLKDHQWQHRVLVVKSLSEKSEQLHEQLKAFENSEAALKERKLVLYKITADSLSYVDYADSTKNYSGKVSRNFAESNLKDHMDFEIILIGLDGTIKFQQDHLLTKDKLFSIIDAMPMRKNEIRN
ncbi:DUF4174 domain-containing protein [Winogradskyella aquimaris]|nr:DUF4174 domain-containing protein [Winogradskyella aquimaris]